jgi:DNA adenine methylase
VNTSGDLFGNGLRPWVKWPGGKTGELPLIKEFSPKKSVQRFIEPFVGGGSVLLDVNSEIPAVANDICPELIHLYQGGATSDRNLRKKLELLAKTWSDISNIRNSIGNYAGRFIDKSITKDEIATELLAISLPALGDGNEDLVVEFTRRFVKDLPSKLMRVEKLQLKHSRELPLEEMIDNIHGCLHSSFYMSIRDRYNSARVLGLYSDTRASDFFFLREFSYASMFRFNAQGGFNVPYGGISYNKKTFLSKVDALYSDKMYARLSNTQWHCSDFEAFFERVKPDTNDFVFVDPPYDSDFSDYDNREFVSQDQERLATALQNLDSNIMVVIGDTPLIRNLYPEGHWTIIENPKIYSWNIKGRNDRNKNHLIITNYL